MSRPPAPRRLWQAGPDDYRHLLESSLQAVILALPDPVRIGYANPAMTLLTGYAFDELLRMAPAELEALVHPGDRARFFGNFLARIEGRPAPAESVYRIIRKDGVVRWARAFSNLIDIDGQRATLSTYVDITEAREHEEALRLHSLVLDQIHDQVTVTDLEGRITYVNEAEVHKLGRSRDELVGSSVTVYGEDPERGATQQQIIRETRERGWWRGEVVNYAADGRELILDCRTQLVRDAEGRAVALCGIATDVTAARRARQGEKMEAIGRLAGGVAHDFNNVLCAITGNTELVLDELPPDSPAREKIEEIAQSAARAAELTRQLLAFSRRQVIAPRAMDLGRLVEQIVPMLRRLVGEDIRLLTRIPTRPSWILADPSQIEQVVMNLVVNARDAQPSGGRIQIEVDEVTPDEGERHVTLRVEDDGHGMSPEVQARIFEPFFTTRPEGEGTGLGLATVYGIVEQSQGRIEVKSAPGAGARFLLHFPQSGAPRDTEGSAPEARPRGGGECVLVVEDEPSVRRVAVRILRRQGYQVLEAASGEEGLALVERHPEPIDLLVSDVVMPGMNGRELAQRVQRLRPQTRVILTSGYTQNIIENHGVLEAGLDFLTKPYSVATLARRVREALDRS